jgi:ATP-dependent metalloprotease
MPSPSSASSASLIDRVRQWFRPLDDNEFSRLAADMKLAHTEPTSGNAVAQDAAAATPVTPAAAVPETESANKETVEKLYEAGQYERAIALFNEQTRVSEASVKAYLRSLAATNQMHHLNVANLVALLLGPDAHMRGGGAGGASGSLSLAMPSEPIPVRIEVPRTTRFWTGVGRLLSIGLSIALVGIIYVGFVANKGNGSGGGGGVLGGLMPKPLHKKAADVNVKFDDVKGCDEVLNELMEVVDFLKDPQQFTKLGAVLPRGVLLTGPPGTGKTLLARAVAGEAGVPFFFTSGSSFDEMFVGVGPKRVRELFDSAKAVKGPCIIFIDEIDAVGSARVSTSMMRSRESLNALLTEMDGFDQNTGIIVMAATNLPQSLDAALLRPGRFDRMLTVPAPDIKGRTAIIDLYLSKKSVSSDVDSTKLARFTPGLTGAELQNVVNTAALKAASRNLTAVSQALLEEAVDDIRMGVIRKSAAATMPADEFANTAAHESGHALVAFYTPGSHPLHKMSILPRGQALGVTYQLPERDVYSYTRQQIMAQIAVLMGGHAAEELRHGADFVTSGAASDFQHATRLATNMVTKFGMSKTIGKVFVDGEEKMSPEVLKEVKSILDERYQYALLLLKSHDAELRRLTTELLDREELSADEIRAVCEGKELQPLPASFGRYRAGTGGGGGGGVVPIPAAAALIQ